jgi:two-component system response regulator HydG
MPQSHLNHLKQLTQLRLLNELTAKLQALITSENIYAEIVHLIQFKFHYHAIHIWSVDTDRAATLRAHAGAYRDRLRVGDVLRPGQGIIGRVAAMGEAYLSNDVSADSHFTSLDLVSGTRSEICVPIRGSKNEILAVLNVESSETDAFDESDLMTLEAVATQVSVILRNRDLYQDVQEFNQRLQHAVESKTLELRKAHERILEQQNLLQRENRALKKLVDQTKGEPEIIGNSASTRDLISMIDRVAPTPATVLIQGESGTGKELVARRLHTRSPRNTHAYVAINCGALQENLLESELFGHEKGAFTGAIQQKIGLCEMADGGTLFLDEVGELSAPMQAKLLRFLQEGELYRIGGKAPIRVDVRVVSATNRDLAEEVREGRFREDLYYRLNTITLRIQPLRRRIEDIPPLVNHFFQKMKSQGGVRVVQSIDPQAMEVLCHYPWPGNIRELQNTIERLCILGESEVIGLRDLPWALRSPQALAKEHGFSVDMTLEAVERNHIFRVMAHYEGNKTRTAQALGITVKTLYNKLHRYGFWVQSPEVSSLGEDRASSVVQ